MTASGDGVADLVTAVAVVGLVVILVAMLVAEALRKAAGRTRH